MLWHSTIAPIAAVIPLWCWLIVVFFVQCLSLYITAFIARFRKRRSSHVSLLFFGTAFSLIPRRRPSLVSLIRGMAFIALPFLNRHHVRRDGVQPTSRPNLRDGVHRSSLSVAAQSETACIARLLIRGTTFIARPFPRIVIALGEMASSRVPS